MNIADHRRYMREIRCQHTVRLRLMAAAERAARGQMLVDLKAQGPGRVVILSAMPPTPEEPDDGPVRH